MSGRHRARTRRIEAGAAVSVGLGALAGGCVPRGAGRSFGDAAVAPGGHTVVSNGLTGIGAIEDGLVTVEAGATLGALARALADTDHGLPVAGGTRHVTVGGAIAADIHGKNDPDQGSFGHHIDALELALADGSRVWCSPRNEPDLFAATVGGMGLTGLILRARLRPVRRLHAGVLRSRHRFEGVEALVASFETHPAPWQAAWCDHSGGSIRGVLHTAVPGPPPPPAARTLDLPLPRVRLYRPGLVAAVNARILAAPDAVGVPGHLWDLVWSVDRLRSWHAPHGRRGCDEFQFACPGDRFPDALMRAAHMCEDAGARPTFAMVKRLGAQPRAGLLSFPREGFTWTANISHAPGNAALFRRLFTEVVIPCGGRGYLAKDAAMTPAQAAAMYPLLEQWQSVVRTVDPRGRLQSGLSRRLELKPWT